jgi:uncharacterized membrane protein HdeD (DUF308 family)
MEHDLRRSWWTLTFRGLLGVLFGLAMIIWPSAGVVALVALFAAFALVDGVVSVAAAFGVPKDSRLWTVLALEGVAGILAGLVALFWPGITAVALLFVAGIWALVVGCLEIAGAVRFRRLIAHDWLYAAGGVLTLLFGLLILMRPNLGGLALIYAIGFMAVMHGVMLMGTGLRVRELVTGMEHVEQRLHA